MKVEEVVVKYYYAQKLDGLLPQTNENNMKQIILIALPFVVLMNLVLGMKAFKRTKKEEVAEEIATETTEEKNNK